jgi:AcrR family transcriptional regulator
MSHVTHPPLRKDAERNRQRLLAAAGELFARRGLDVTLNDVAHHAGVGVGTAYRRWANKEQLIDELFAQRLDEHAALAQHALEDPDAWHGLTTFMEQSLRMQLEDRGLNELITNPALGQELVNAARDRNAPLVNAVVDRAKAAGCLRPEFEGTDLVFIQVALTALMDRTRDIDPALYRRYLTIFLDGVRADRGPLSELPVAALSTDETHTVMTSGRTPLPAAEAATSETPEPRPSGQSSPGNASPQGPCFGT